LALSPVTGEIHSSNYNQSQVYWQQSIRTNRDCFLTLFFKLVQ
jgi:hypothetical protein